MSFHFEAFQQMALSQLWQLTAVICIAGILTLFVSRRRPHLAYVLWLIVLLKAITPPVWSSPTSVFSWTGASVAKSDVAAPPANEFSPTPAGRIETSTEPSTEASPEPRPLGSGPAPRDPATSVTPPAPSRSGLGSHGEADAEYAPPKEASLTERVDNTRDEKHARHGISMLQLAEILAVAWLCGAAALGGLLIGRWSYYFVLLRHHRVDSDNRISSLVDQLSKKLGVRRHVEVLITTRPFGPAVCGLWRPMLILPQALIEEESSEHIERIIAHELIHVRRGDNLVGVLQLIAQVVWWFHPLVWWTNRRMCVEREQCCDEQVVASLRCDPGTYAQSLLDMLKLRRQLRPAILPGIDAPEVTKRRLENIMDHRKTFHRRMPLACWIMLIVGIMLVVPGAGFTFAEKGDTATVTSEFDGPQLMQLGWTYWGKCQYKKAAAKFEQAVKLLPNDANAWNGLGWARFNSGKAKAGQKAFERAVKLQKDHPAALNGLGQVYLSQRKYDQAEKYLLKAAPKASAAWFGLARLYLLQGKFAEAEPWAQKILDSGQGNKKSLAQVRLMLKAAQKKHLSADLRVLIEPQVAKKQKTLAKATPPSELDGPQLMKLGWTYWRKHQFDKAAAKFEQAVKLLPNDANAWNGLGWARFNSGNAKAGREAFERAVELQADHPAALNGLGQIFLAQRKYDQAEKYLVKAAPKAQAAWFGLARLYLLQGKFDKAEPWAKKIVDLAQGDKMSLAQARLFLKAAQQKHLSDDLRTLIEPPATQSQDTKETSPAEPVVEPGVGTVHEISLDESVDLQKLIDEAKPGGVVKVPAGTYEEPIEINKPITLVGEDAKKCILELVSDKPILMITSKKPATIDSLTFRWKRATSRRPSGPTGAIAAKDGRATLKNCRIIASGSPARCPNGINCEGFSDVNIENCFCKGFEYCINYMGGAEGKISDCVVVNPGHCGITVYTDSKIDIGRCVVTGSRFHGFRSTGGTILAHDNLIIENKNRGIYLGNRPASGVIRNNVILGNGVGISAYAGTDTKIENNIFAQCDFAGLAAAAAAPVLVKNNIFYKNAKGFAVFQQEGRKKVKLQENTYWKNKENTENIDPADGSIVADPKFKNYRKGDFTPRTKKIAEAKQGLTDPSVMTKLWKKWKALSKEE